MTPAERGTQDGRGSAVDELLREARAVLGRRGPEALRRYAEGVAEGAADAGVEEGVLAPGDRETYARAYAQALEAEVLR